MNDSPLMRILRRFGAGGFLLFIALGYHYNYLHKKYNTPTHQQKDKEERQRYGSGYSGGGYSRGGFGGGSSK